MTTNVQPNKLRVIDIILSGMAANAFAALSTLPLFCLHKIETPSPGKLISERFDKWQADIVACQIILETIDGTESARKSMENLLAATVRLRDGFLQLANWRGSSAEILFATHEELVAAYRDIENTLEYCGKLLGFRIAFLAQRGRLKEIGHSRNMEGLLKLLEEIVLSEKK